jgi:Zn-dependent peptidase ImmA (M78 family)
MNKKPGSFLLNPNRIQYLLDLYDLGHKDFIKLIHQKRKRKLLTVAQLNYALDKGSVDISVLKLIDKTFRKGLTWYISKRDLPDPKKSSIFFRKNTFNSKLDFESKKVVNKYEELKIEIQTLCKFINFTPKQMIKSYSLKDNPKQVAHEVRTLYNEIEQKLIKENVISPSKTEREFLKNSIRILDELNIFTFEFIEAWNKINKVSFNGIFIFPSIIVIKRQKFLRREIFTLFHELAHYLLKLEEIDDVNDNEYNNKNAIEKWCHEFSFYFLVDSLRQEFVNLSKANSNNNFHKDIIYRFYKNTYLSYSAFYTRLRIENKISQTDYDSRIEEIKSILEKLRHEEEQKRKLEREIAKEQRIDFFPPKPIESNLFKEIVKINYFEGNINESRLRDYLHISDSKNINEVIY